MNDTDKNLGAAETDKSDVKRECRRQLYDTTPYRKSSEVAKNKFIKNTQFSFFITVEKHVKR